jgi:hypothetical protein
MKTALFKQVLVTRCAGPLRAQLANRAAMNRAMVKRVLLPLCAIAGVGFGYRVLVAATQTPAVIAAIDVQHRGDGRLMPASVHRQLVLNTATHAAAQAPAPASHSGASSVATSTAAAIAPTKTAAATAAKPAAASSPRARLIALRAPLSVESANNPFAASSWLPPPPPVVVPVVAEAPPPAPTAPPVPFTYLGELDVKAAKPQVFLSSGDRLLIVSPGEVVDNQYRVESVSASDVVLTYLPLNQTQVITIPREAQ